MRESGRVCRYHEGSSWELRQAGVILDEHDSCLLHAEATRSHRSPLGTPQLSRLRRPHEATRCTGPLSIATTGCAPPLCQDRHMELLCPRRVAVSAAEYDVFEQMHYVCFHYGFEHGEFDVDEECDAGGCPSALFGFGRRSVVETARALAIESASDAPWHNSTLHAYLEALAGWIEDSDGTTPVIRRRTAGKSSMTPPGSDGLRMTSPQGADRRSCTYGNARSSRPRRYPRNPGARPTRPTRSALTTPRGHL